MPGICESVEQGSNLFFGLTFRGKPRGRNSCSGMEIPVERLLAAVSCRCSILVWLTWRIWAGDVEEDQGQIDVHFVRLTGCLDIIRTI